MNKCIFLDRDGVINVDCVDYTYKLEDFIILDGVLEAIRGFKEMGYLLVVITNQSGIAKGIYGHEDVKICHDYLQSQCQNRIDSFYYSPYHQNFTNSLTRKPESLMFEKAAAKHKIDYGLSYMVGDRGRDLIPARKLGIKTVLVGDDEPVNINPDLRFENLFNVYEYLKNS